MRQVRSLWPEWPSHRRILDQGAACLSATLKRRPERPDSNRPATQWRAACRDDAMAVCSAGLSDCRTPSSLACLGRSGCCPRRTAFGHQETFGGSAGQRSFEVATDATPMFRPLRTGLRKAGGHQGIRSVGTPCRWAAITGRVCAARYRPAPRHRAPFMRQPLKAFVLRGRCLNDRNHGLRRNHAHRRES